MGQRDSTGIQGSIRVQALISLLFIRFDFELLDVYVCFGDIERFSLNKTRIRIISGEDQVLLAIAKELGVFIPYIGGVEHAHILLTPLETLCTIEETCVRDKAVESLCRIGSQMKESDLNEWFIPLVKGCVDRIRGMKLV
ncbi:hypothetical protein AgCh_033913 [Apium graveolens]